MRTAPHFDKLTWPELVDAAAEERVALLPAGTIEDHGLHLPVDTDVVIAGAICEAAAALVPDDVILVPPIVFGFSPHHIDGPGTLTTRWDTFISATCDLTASLIHHGFTKILIVNGHGSNEPVLDLAARQTVVTNPDAQCAFTSWWGLKDVQEVVRELRDSTWTGHACELETSLYLAIEPEVVQMDKARADINPFISRHFWADLVGQAPEGYANPVRLTEYWSTVTATGTLGDPTVATPEKGRAILKAAANELAEVLLELKARPVRSRRPDQGAAVRERNLARELRTPRFT
jgi:creatinine amidohydrolase